MKKFAAILLLVLIGICTGIYLWNKPTKKVEDTNGIIFTAVALSKEYTTNEKNADAKYIKICTIIQTAFVCYH